ncbi:MAG: hypothetical protein MUP47_01395 [Phycisphaerae bacterium]|nr:hypothetical protein [Phycisphaerae bacterium]
MARQTDTGYDHHRGAQPLLQQSGPVLQAAYAAANLAVFCTVNVFWRYLATGQWVDISLSSYRRDLGTPLGEILLRPLSVFSHPWMILVAGVLLGGMIFAPILITVLHRLALAAVFVTVVAAVGHAPVLGAALGVGCLLAARTRLRSDMPFLAVLLGLALVAVYLYFFALFGFESSAVQPIQRLVLVAPFVLAVVVAVLGAAVALGLARATGFRPDVIWPVMLVVAAVPVVAFYALLGPAELEYTLIAEQLATGDPVFEPVTLDAWSRQNPTEGLNPQTLRIRIEDDLERRWQELAARCLRFVERYPGSERAAAALWVAAQAASAQLDGPALQVGLIKCSASYPVQASASLWERLGQEYPRSPQAGLAHWRLGELAMRRGEVHQAYTHLVKAQEELTRRAAQPAAPPGGGPFAKIFSPEPSVPSDRYYDEAAFAVRRLQWLMDSNDVLNALPSAEALAAYLNCNPRDTHYLDLLSRLAGLYEQTHLGDNLKLAVALACPNLYERAEMLILLADRGDTDAAIEANYELGRLTMRTAEAPALPLVENLRQPEDYFRAIQAASPSPWKPLAEEHLASLARRTASPPASPAAQE